MFVPVAAMLTTSWFALCPREALMRVFNRIRNIRAAPAHRTGHLEFATTAGQIRLPG
jgi:hypothetical protein